MEPLAVDLLIGPVLAILLASAGMLYKAGVAPRDAFKKENRLLLTALGLTTGLLVYPVVVVWMQRGLDPGTASRLYILDRKVMYTAVIGVAFLFYLVVGGAGGFLNGPQRNHRQLKPLCVIEGLAVYPFIGLVVLTRRAGEAPDPDFLSSRAHFLDQGADAWMAGFVLSVALHMFLIRKKIRWDEPFPAKSIAGLALAHAPALAAAVFFTVQATQ